MLRPRQRTGQPSIVLVQQPKLGPVVFLGTTTYEGLPAIFNWLSSTGSSTLQGSALGLAYWHVRPGECLNQANSGGFKLRKCAGRNEPLGDLTAPMFSLPNHASKRRTGSQRAIPLSKIASRDAMGQGLHWPAAKGP